MGNNKIGTVEAIMSILTIVVAHTILSLPRILILNTNSSTILNLIYLTIIAMALAYLIYFLLKKFPGLDIVDISENLGGKVFKNIVGAVFIFHFITNSSLLLRNFCEGLKILYFPLTDILFIILLFVIAVCISIRLGPSSVYKTNLIIIPLTLVSIVALFVFNLENFVPQRMFPILGNGFFSTFVLGLTNLSAFGGIAYIYFLPPLLKTGASSPRVPCW